MRYPPNMDMQELGRSMSQPLQPGMNQYRPRYPPAMHPQPEHSPVYYEGQPRYPAAGPRMSYGRPTPEYGTNYSGNYQNPQMFPPMRPQSPVLHHLDPGAMPYIPAKYIPPVSGAFRGEAARPRSVVDPNLRGLPIGLSKSYVNPPMTSVPIPPGYRDSVPRSKSPVPPFYLGTNKRPMSTDGISEEERKNFGIEKFLDNLKSKKGLIGMMERGIDPTTLGLKLDSSE